MKIQGCDLHAKQQTIAMVATNTGEFRERTLAREGNAVREFYAALDGPVVVGIEATGSMQWFWNCWTSWGLRVGWVMQRRSERRRRGSRNMMGGMRG
jgi:hypothetical protein